MDTENLIKIPLDKSKWKLIYEQLKMTMDIRTGDGGYFRSGELERLTEIAFRASEGVEWSMTRPRWEALVACLAIKDRLPFTCQYIRNQLDGKPCQPTSDDIERRDELGLSEKSNCVAIDDPEAFCDEAWAAWKAFNPGDAMRSIERSHKLRCLKFLAWGLIAGSILAIWVLVL